jgi:DNA (cytosine-5)-methyltransferase 1
VILNTGDYDAAKKELKRIGLDSEKRNYNVLRPDSQSPTMMTIPDDYIHFSSPRTLTVREMARLQSFDDSFVFQGKLNLEKTPKWNSGFSQIEMVGESTPPLLCREIRKVILRHIR